MSKGTQQDLQQNLQQSLQQELQGLYTELQYVATQLQELQVQAHVLAACTTRALNTLNKARRIPHAAVSEK